MKLLDWAAILGALAWTPYLISIIKYWFTKPKVRVITQKSVEIGFTTYGPIFNLLIAFAVENKDIVISDIKVRLTHESGEEKVFEWQSITQQLGKMTMPDSGVMPYEKEHSVLAIKLNQKDIEERFIRFQEPIFIELQRKHVDKAVKKIAYLKSENKFDGNTFLREQEMKELYSFNKQFFSWQQGKYKVAIEMQSPEDFSILDYEREFNLTSLDVEELEKNKNNLESDYSRMIVGSGEDDDLIWQWRNPILTKI